MVFVNREPLLQNGGVSLVWYFNPSVVTFLGATTVNFSYVDTRGRVIPCTSIRCVSILTMSGVYYTINNRSTTVYDKGSWQNEMYRTITFEQEPSGELLRWLQTNATPV